MILVGPAIIVSSIGTGYYYGALLGVALEAWGIWETPEIHPYLKLVFNWKTRNRSPDVQLDQSPNSNPVTIGGDVGGDVNVYSVSPEKERVAKEPESEQYSVETPARPVIDDTPLLLSKKDISYTITFKKDEDITVEVNADYPVTVELISFLEWEKKRQDERYSAEKYRTKVKNANIEFSVRVWKE